MRERVGTAKKRVVAPVRAKVLHITKIIYLN